MQVATLLNIWVTFQASWRCHFWQFHCLLQASRPKHCGSMIPHRGAKYLAPNSISVPLRATILQWPSKIVKRIVSPPESTVCPFPGMETHPLPHPLGNANCTICASGSNREDSTFPVATALPPGNRLYWNRRAAKAISRNRWIWTTPRDYISSPMPCD